MPTIRSAPAARAYAAYLQTAGWRTRRNQALRDASYACGRCGATRDLEVHHRSYERLGAERPQDLEVVCHGCHKGHHWDETQTQIGLYMRVLSDVLRDHGRDHLSDIIEETKARCVCLRIPLHVHRFNAALARVLPRIAFAPPATHAELYRVAEEGTPIGKAEAAGILARFGLAPLMKHVPNARPLTARQVACRRAQQIILQGILEQIQRCEAAERFVELERRKEGP